MRKHKLLDSLRICNADSGVNEKFLDDQEKILNLMVKYGYTAGTAIQLLSELVYLISVCGTLDARPNDHG